MPLKAPSWWYSAKIPAAAWPLRPVSFTYGSMVQARFALAAPYKSSLPVICIGNYTMGGAGKTPLAIAVASLLRGVGFNPAFLTRGYGGRLPGPHRVSPADDAAELTGDEPLLLARAGTTVVSRDRVAGARFIERLGADIIVMDDGFQNPSLVKTFSAIAVDGGVGLGCAKVFPLGPLRAPLAFQLKRTNAAVVLGGGHSSSFSPSDWLGGVVVLNAGIVPADVAAFAGGTFVAFCGIGRPAKFFETLDAAGITTTRTFGFPDHHPYTGNDARLLLGEAAKTGARLITTEKDFVRLKGKPGVLNDLYEATRPLAIRAEFIGDGKARLTQLIMDAIRSSSR